MWREGLNTESFHHCPHCFSAGGKGEGQAGHTGGQLDLSLSQYNHMQLQHFNDCVKEQEVNWLN